MAECIHGLDDGLCDICFPKEQPLNPVPGTVRSGAKRRTAGSSAVREKATRSARTPEGKPLPPFGQRRIHHVTHLRNLETILFDGAITAGADPELDLLAEEARAKRRQTEVIHGTSVAEFISFSLSPNAIWWDEVLTGATDDRWSASAKSSPGTQYVQLVGTVATAGTDVAASDEDAMSPTARFGLGVDAAGTLVRRAALDDPELRRPEVLVRGRYRTSDLVLLAVPNEPVRDKVKAMLREHKGASPRIVVYPPWFQPIPIED